MRKLKGRRIVLLLWKPAERALASQFYLMISKFPECTLRAVIRVIVTLGVRGTGRTVCGGSESYRGGQPQLLCSKSAWLRPTVTKVEKKSISVKLLSSFTIWLNTTNFWQWGL